MSRDTRDMARGGLRFGKDCWQMEQNLTVGSEAASLDVAKEFLGKPTVEGKGYAIYQGDCLQLMAQLPSSSLPLTVTSPPYNIGKEYEAIKRIDSYIDWCAEWIAEVYRATSSDGTFWLNLGYFPVPERGKAVPIPYLLWNRVPFYLLQEVVWQYGAGVSARLSFSPRNEKFLWYLKNPENYVFNLDAVRDPNVKYPNQKKNGKLKCNPLGKNPGDVWYFPKVTSGRDRASKERTEHPAQFPVAVIDRIIKASSHEGDLILDPFMGSGSTLEAAIRCGRTAIGFEIEPKYIQIAAKRLARVSASLNTLF